MASFKEKMSAFFSKAGNAVDKLQESTGKFLNKFMSPQTQEKIVSAKPAVWMATVVLGLTGLILAPAYVAPLTICYFTYAFTHDACIKNINARKEADGKSSAEKKKDCARGRSSSKGHKPSLDQGCKNCCSHKFGKSQQTAKRDFENAKKGTSDSDHKCANDNTGSTSRPQGHKSSPS